MPVNKKAPICIGAVPLAMSPLKRTISRDKPQLVLLASGPNVTGVSQFSFSASIQLWQTLSGQPYFFTFTLGERGAQEPGFPWQTGTVGDCRRYQINKSLFSCQTKISAERSFFVFVVVVLFFYWQNLYKFGFNKVAIKFFNFLLRIFNNAIND